MFFRVALSVLLAHMMVSAIDLSLEIPEISFRSIRMGQMPIIGLAEVFLPNITSREEFLDVATLLYRVNKHSLSLPCHHRETEKIVHRNMRMGIGITGILQCPEKLDWCDYVYTELRKFDVAYSKKHGFKPSIKLTTCKPSIGGFVR